MQNNICVFVYLRKFSRRRPRNYSRIVRCKNDSVCEPLDATLEIQPDFDIIEDDDIDDDIPQSGIV